MNKRVVLILVCLMLAVGGLSIYQKRGPSSDPSAQTSATPVAAPSATASPIAQSTPEASASTGGDKKPYIPPRPAKVSGRLKAHLFSTSPEGDAMTTFPLNTESVFLILTPEGIPNRVEMKAALRSALVEKAEFSEGVSDTGSARRRIFKLDKPAKGWTPGPYQVMLKAARGKSVYGHLRFEIAKTNNVPKTSYKAPHYLDLSEELKSPKRSTFTTETPQIYLRVATYEIPEGTPVRTIWSAVEVNGLTAGELVAVSERAAPDPKKDCIFLYSPPYGGFLKGAYKVDVYFEDQKVGSQAFFVQPPLPPKESDG